VSPQGQDRGFAAPPAPSPEAPSWGPFSLGDGPDACLLLHGFTGSPHEVRPLGEALAAAGMRAVAPLLAGHGEAPEALLGVDRRDLYESAREALRGLRGARRVYCVGLSAGALLALELCARVRVREGDPDISAVALLAPAIRFSGSLFLLGNVLGRLPALPLPLPLLLRKGPRDLGEAQDPKLLGDGRRGDGSYGKVPLAWGRELRLLSEEALALAPRVRAPALVLQGALDKTVAPSGARLLCEKLGSRKVELRTFARSGHLLPLDREGTAVCAAVTDFLTRPRP
jgi:carboxylesterase